MPRVLLATLLFLAALPAFAAQSPLDAGMPPFPALTGPVVDDAHLLPGDTFNSLSQTLAAYSRETGTQLVVVTLPTLKGYPIDEYGYQLGRHWGIGQKGKNNGALLIVDKGEKQVRIEVGYGLEGTLTDAQSFAIIHNVIAPRFRQGDYAGGIAAGTEAILSVLGNRHDATEQQQQVRDRSGTGFLMLLMIVFVLSPLIATIFGRGGRGGPGSRGGGSGWLGWLALGMLSGGRGGGFGGGGFGGGGFGGFSGGGGSFGGGGASGGW